MPAGTTRRNRECVHNSAGLSAAALRAPPRSSRSQMHIKPRAYAGFLLFLLPSFFTPSSLFHSLVCTHRYNMICNREIVLCVCCQIRMEQHYRELEGITYVRIDGAIKFPSTAKSRRIGVISARRTTLPVKSCCFFFFLRRKINQIAFYLQMSF